MPAMAWKPARLPAAPKARNATNINPHMIMPCSTASILFSPTVSTLVTTPPMNIAAQVVKKVHTTALVFKVVGLARSVIDRPTAAPRIVNRGINRQSQSSAGDYRAPTHAGAHGFQIFRS